MQLFRTPVQLLWIWGDGKGLQEVAELLGLLFVAFPIDIPEDKILG